MIRDRRKIVSNYEQHKRFSVSCCVRWIKLNVMTMKIIRGWSKALQRLRTSLTPCSSLMYTFRARKGSRSMTWIASHCKPQKHQSKSHLTVGEDKLFKVSLPLRKISAFLSRRWNWTNFYKPHLRGPPWTAFW